MGYTASDLVIEDAQQVAGVVRVYVAQRPSTAVVVGLGDPTFELWPNFVDGSLTPLWGRRDVFKTFVIGVDEVAQQFHISTRE